MVFDDFLATPTWVSSHPLDDSRFFHALSAVVEHPDFDADAMGNYFRERSAARSAGDKALIDERIASLVTRARKVQELL
jgi:hypothetical protein